MNDIIIKIGKTDWEFLEKNEDRTCEIINTITKQKLEGLIKQLSSNGTYTIEIKNKKEE